MAGNVLFASGLFFHAFLYNFYLQELGAAESIMGYAAAALTAGGLVALLPAGQIVDRAGARVGLVTAAAVCGAGLVFGAVVVAPMPIYFAAALAGAGGGLWRVAVAPMLMRVTVPATRPRVFAWNVGLLLASGGLGLAVAGVVPDWLERAFGIQPLAALRAGLVLGAAGTGLSLPCFALAVPSEKRANAPPVPRPDLRAPAIMRRLLPLIGLVAAWMTGPALAAPFFNLYFARSYTLPIDRVGIIFAAAHLVWALGVFGSGEVALRFGARKTMAVTLMMFAPALLGLALVSHLGPALALYTLQGLISPVTNPLIDQMVLDNAPVASHGAVSSWRNIAADVSAIVGASLGGVLLERAGFGGLFLGAGSVGFIGALALVLALRSLLPPLEPRLTDANARSSPSQQ